MYKRGIGTLMWLMLALAGIASAQTCQQLDPEVATNELAGTLSGYGCFVGYADANVDWTLSRADLNDREAVVSFDAAAGSALALVSQTGDQLATLQAGETATWVLQPGTFRLRVDNAAGDRFVVSTVSGTWRSPIDVEPRGSDRRMRQSGSFDQITRLEEDAYYISWELRDDDPLTWQLLFRPGPGVPLNVKLFDPDGNLLEHVTGEPGQEANVLPLELRPGTYTFVIAQSEWPGAAMQVSTVPLGQVAEGGQKTGRTNSWQTANRISIGGVRGALEEDSTDVFRLEVSADEAGTYILNAGNEADMILCVRDARNEELACYRGVDISVGNLQLAAGTYYLTISGHRPDQDAYHLSFEPQAEPEPQVVTAPAGRMIDAHLIPEGTARVTLGSRTATWLAYPVTEPGLYRVQMQGTDAVTLYVLDGGGSELRRVNPSPGQSVRIDNVPLREGMNYLQLDARPGEYAIRVLRVGDLPELDVVVPAAPATDVVAARPEAAVVPSLNVSRGSASLLRPGIPYTATLLPNEQTAYYRFSLQNEAMVRVTLTPPDGTDMRLYLEPGTSYDTSDYDGPLVVDDWFPAGDYAVNTRVLGAGDGWYTLQVDLLDPFNPHSTWNVHEKPVPAYIGSDLRVQITEPLAGRSYYLLPVLEEATTMTVSRADEGGGIIRLYPVGGDEIASVSREDNVTTYELEAGAYVLRFDNGYTYDVQVEISNGPVATNSTLLEDVNLELELEESEVAAWSFWGQRLGGTLHLENSGDNDFELELYTHSTDPRVKFDWSADGPWQLPAGQTLEVPVELVLPADVSSGNTLDFNVAVSDGSSLMASTRSSVLPSCEAPLIGGHSWWPLPESLLGHLNVAWMPFGATLLSGTSSDLPVFDGRISPARPPVRTLPYEYVLDLGAAKELVATTLHPTAAGNGFEQAREFELAISDDGDDWTTVLTESLSSARVEQWFMFDEPVTARYVRLTLLSAIAAGANAGIGEWKLLAEPDGVQHNIAASALGGHILHSAPLLDSGASMLLDADYGAEPRRSRVTVRAGNPLPEWVIGFHHNRAASISELQWLDNESEQNISQLEVLVSTESPLGPWTHLADWQLDRQDGTASLQLAEPVWARFLHFRVLGGPRDQNTDFELPLTLKVIESGATPSILGEWGFDSDWSAYEYSNPELFAEATVVFGSNGTRADALLVDTSETGYVQTGTAEGWFRFTMPPDRNLAQIRIASEPGVTLGYELFDSDDAIVSSGLSDEGNLSVTGAPGSKWLLRVYEPPRSVLFAWDTSGSVSPYERQTYAALEGFAGAIRGDMEAVMLMAYGNPPAFLLPEWSGSSQEVSLAINQYAREEDSSDSQFNLLQASEALAGRQGARAIVLITDAETGGYRYTQDLWASLADSGAQVYSLEVSSAGGAVAQDLMQDWASANGGHYVNATDLVQLEHGFARADCLIRRPKYVEVSVEYQEREAVPGTLTVTRVEASETGEPEAALASTGGILVILDSSGSMYRTLDGRYRYEIAKDVLSDLVTNVLPDQVPFALRVFGNREANICRSDLEVALAPLDASSVSAVIAGIEPQPFAGTPIAASLQAAVSDLASATGARTVVLITDGEESCDGDVEAAIEELRAGGLDVVLNVIGFDFDADDVDAARERFRSWAELGGGQYFDASSADELAGALESSVALPFEVLDEDQVVVARGTVNGPAVELDGGLYTVRVLGEEPVVFEGVRVDGEGVSLPLE